uniref:Putative e3 ubiquitin ligase n=1 Tax=Culex tarsalis TaxID=7177 RepID=A0A1Q3FWQ7_CULTA
MATGGGGGGGPVPSRFPPRDVGRDPYMGGHPAVKSDSMGYYDDPARQVPIPQQQQPQQQAPTPSVEPPPPGFEEQDNWSGKQESDYRAPANVTAIKPVNAEEPAAYDYHNTPKSRDEQRGHTPVIRDGDRHHHHDPDKEAGSGKKKSRDDGGREERRVARSSKTPERHDKSKRGEREDKDKKRPRDVSKDKRGAEKERHREVEKSRERETKRKQQRGDSSEEEKRDKKKEKDKKKRKKEKEAEKKKHKKERKDKDKRSKEGKKERKTVEKEEADSSLQPATPKHAPRREDGEKEQPQVDTTQEYMAHELDDTLVIPERCHDLSKTASEGEDNSYREEPSSSHDQQEEQNQHLQEQVDHDHSDLYSDIPDKYEGDQLEKSVLEGHLGEEEDADLVNSSGVAAEDQDEIKRSDSILDLHANLDFEGELEEGEHQSPPKFIGIPELSKWELDEDTPHIASTDRKVTLAADDGSSNGKHDDSSTKVTTEVLKRAENAIFTRAINAIRPIEIKKISVDRQKLYANESGHEHEHDVVEIKSEKQQQDELKRFQVTVPTNDDHAERSVEIKGVDGAGGGKLDSRASPVRGSIKERLGSKITDVIRGSSSSTFSRSRTPPQASTGGGLRKVKSSTGGAGGGASKLVDSTTSRKRSRSKSGDRDGSSRSRRDDRGGGGGGRRGEEIKISSSSSGGSRRVDIARRVVVAVREVTPDKRGDGRSKDRRSRERVAKEASSSVDRSRDRVVRRSRERSREKRMEREREREKERKRGGDGKDSRRKSPEKARDDKKVAVDRKRTDGDSERRRRDRSVSPARRSKDEDPSKRFVEVLGRVVQEEVIPAKKSKSDKSIAGKLAKPAAASSSDSSSSDSESSSSDSSSESDDEAAARKRKKRKHKKDRKRAKRSASTDSDDSGGKKKKKSKKSKSGKKKKKEKKHRKGE